MFYLNTAFVCNIFLGSTTVLQWACDKPSIKLKDSFNVTLEYKRNFKWWFYYKYWKISNTKCNEIYWTFWILHPRKCCIWRKLAFHLSCWNLFLCTLHTFVFRKNPSPLYVIFELWLEPSSVLSFKVAISWLLFSQGLTSDDWMTDAWLLSPKISKLQRQRLKAPTTASGGRGHNRH